MPTIDEVVLLLSQFVDEHLIATMDVRLSQRAIARSTLRLRLDAGWTQAEVAKLARTTQARVSEVEALKGDPKLSTIARIAFALGYIIDMVPIETERAALHMPKKKATKKSKPGPKPETLKLEGDWQDAVAHAMKRGKPESGDKEHGQARQGAEPRLSQAHRKLGAG